MKLPLIIVAGFLGAGKTSLLRHLLLDSKARDFRVALIINEFGAEDIDSQILRAADAELLASIAGGCACCSGQNDLLDALHEIAARKTSSQQVASVPDALVLEASGVADAESLLDVVTAPDLLDAFAVASILCVADAERLANAENAEYSGLSHSGFSQQAQRRRLLLADTIALNKTDLVSPPQVENIVEMMRRINPRAAIFPCSFGAMPLETFWPRIFNAIPQPPLSTQGMRPEPHANFHGIVVEMPHEVTRIELEDFLRALPGEECEGGVWRAKGFVKLRGEEGVFLVQFTGGAGGGRFHVAPFRTRAELPKTNLVFIGPALDVETLQVECAALMKD